MHNIKYHLVTIFFLVIFSYTLATTINQIVKYSISPTYQKGSPKTRDNSLTPTHTKKKNFTDYLDIIESGFFQVAIPEDNSEEDLEEPADPPCPLESLSLMGTITGSTQVARAMIKKKGEKNAEIFALKEINDELNNKVYGHKLIKIENSKVVLEAAGEKNELYLFEIKSNDGSDGGKNLGKGDQIKKTISRAEIQQKVLNNIDNAMRGLRAGPYRKNGKIEGYRIIRVRPYNILYKLGARNGDIAKRINGHPINSTEKLFQLWQTIKNESHITVDLERGGKMLSYELNITD